MEEEFLTRLINADDDFDDVNLAGTDDDTDDEEEDDEEEEDGEDEDTAADGDADAPDEEE